MPTIQIIGQEKLAARNSAADRQLQREKMQQEAADKSMQFEQMSQELKIKAKQAENESERNRILNMSNRMDFIANTYDKASKYDEPDKVVKQMFMIAGKEVTDTVSQPEVADMIGSLGQTADSKWKNTLTNAVQSKLNNNTSQGATANPAMTGAGSPGAAGFGGMGQGGMSQAPGVANQPQTNAFAGAPQSPMGGFDNSPIITDMNEGGATVNFADELYRKGMATSMGSEGGKPLSENVANAIAFKEESGPIFQELFKQIDDYGTKGVGMGFYGGAKMNAGSEAGPGQALLRQGLPPNDPRREMSLNLNKIKQIAFTYGGKTLSDSERNLVFAALSPVNKSLAQWKKDLAWAQRRLSRAADLQTNPMGNMGVYQGQQPPSYSGSTSGNTPKRTKMINGYMVSY